MSYEKRLKEINERLFGLNPILNSKKGDTVYYTGGYFQDLTGTKEEIGKNNSAYTVGKKYILRRDTTTEDYSNFLNLRGERNEGHVYILADNTGSTGGWASALFATEREYQKLKEDRIL